MADYYSLIERAVANLAPDNVSGRAEKYRQAEKALANYLAGMNPPMSAEGVQTEMAALASACRQVEAKFASPGPASPAPEPPPATIRPPGLPPVETKAPSAPVAPAPPPQPAAQPPAQPVSPPQWRPPVQSPATQTQRPPLPDAVSQTRARDTADETPARRGYLVFLVLGLLAIGAAAGVAEFLLPPKPLSKPVAIATTKVHKVKVEPVTPPAAEPAAPAKNTAQVGTSNDTSATAAASSAAAPPATDNSAADQTPASQPAQDQTLVASHALLVIQVAPAPGATGDQPTQKGYQGTATWRVVDVNNAGQPLQKAVVANAEIPDADMSVKVTIQKNTDKVFPASHTIRVDFKQLPGNTTGAVKVMLMPAMREEAKPAGTPLIGLTTPVLDNHFIVALQDDPNVETKNLDLLKARPWIDLRVRFANGLVAVLSIEKGTQGDQALGEALKSWGE
ncbi:MAG: hypothetical protein KGQ37_08245 [Hyphomicrobiales bacterium]|nr:hypothetical protein [Hyphomicrobiales bacterium]